MTVTQVWPPAPDQPVDLLRRYPRNDHPTLRMNFVASLDGAVTLDGRSGGLSGPADKEIFGALRMTCDALIVAAGTIRAENYDALRLDERSRAWRRAHGLPEFPLMVILSGSLELNPEQLIFADAPIPPIVLTHGAAPGSRRARLADVAEVVLVGADRVDLPAAIAALHARGATQVLCEGGPQLFGAMIADDLVDELCLTVAPLLTAGDAGRIAAGPGSPPRRMSLVHILTAEDMLFLRYARPLI
jgi:riboflavin-specific deaminase-like protein